MEAKLKMNLAPGSQAPKIQQLCDKAKSVMKFNVQINTSRVKKPDEHLPPNIYFKT